MPGPRAPQAERVLTRLTASGAVGLRARGLVGAVDGMQTLGPGGLEMS